MLIYDGKDLKDAAKKLSHDISTIHISYDITWKINKEDIRDRLTYNNALFN